MFIVRDLVADRLSTAEQSVLQEAFEHLTAEPEYSYFGALGVNLFDFIPSTPLGEDNNEAAGGRLDAYSAIWREMFRILSDEENPEDPNRNILAVLQRARTLINDISEIADDEALFKLAGLQDRIEQVGHDREIIDAFLPKLSNPQLFQNVNDLINEGMGPVAAVEPGAPIPPPEQWALRDHVTAFRTGDFANRLIARAKESENPRFLAYAYGFKIAYVSKVVGSPFINSITGSVPRLHWWRGRWIERFVDAWTWGFYDPNRPETEAGESIDFTTWRGLCNAELHKRLALGALSEANPIEVMQQAVLGRPLPEAVPSDFRSFWLETFEEVYGSDGNLGLVTGLRLNDALVWSWLTLWFTTSAGSLGCNPAPPTSIADGTAFFDPASVNPFVPDDDDGDTESNEGSPLEIEPEFEPDRRRTACGIILAILGFALLGLGSFFTGLSGLAGGILLIIRGEKEIDWKQLRQDLYALRWYLYNSVDGLNRMLLVSGLGHPYPFELDDTETRLNLPQIPLESFQSGSILYTSRRTGQFPARLWNSDNPMESWVFQPPEHSSNVELPPTVGYGKDGAFPSFFIDDAAANPILNGNILDHREFPPPRSWPDPMHFVYGNAVDNAVDAILREAEEELLNLNLQGDRGVGFGSWVFSGPTYNPPVTIEPTL